MSINTHLLIHLANPQFAAYYLKERFLMDKPKEKQTPDVDLPLTYIEMQDMLSGKKFTWELPNRNDGKKTIIHAYLDNRGIFIEKEE